MAPNYGGLTITTIDLGRLGPSSIVSDPDGSSVRVVGSSGSNAAVWTEEAGVVNLKAPTPGTANDMNAAGQVVGERSAEDLAASRAIYWSSKQDESIDLPTPARSSFATAINAGGQIVGQSFDNPRDPATRHAVLWTVDASGNVETRDLHEETFKPLGFLESTAADINNHSQIVGQATDSLVERPFLWDNGIITFLSAPSGYDSFVTGISNPGLQVHVSGIIQTRDGSETIPVLWTVAGGISSYVELAPSGFAYDVRDTTPIQVVGRTDNPKGNNGHSLATLWLVDADGTVSTVGLGEGAAAAIDQSAPFGLIRIVGHVSTSGGGWKGKELTQDSVLWILRDGAVG